MIYFLNPPDNEQTRKIAREVEDAESYNSSTRLNLGNRKLKQLQNIVVKNYNAWDEAYGTVRKELKELNQLMEGTQPETDFPFGAESSSQIDLRLPAEKFRSLRSNFRRSVFGNPNFIVASMKPGSGMNTSQRNKLEEALNWTVKEMCNLYDVLKDTDLPCFRDGTGLVYGESVKEVETGMDTKIYTDANEFQSDYPDVESAGCSEEEYNEILEKLLSPEDNEVRIEYEMDFVSKNGPQYTLFPLINFIHYPFYPEKVGDFNLYGYTYKEGRQKFLELKKHGHFYPDAVEDISDNFNSAEYEDEWDRERDRTEGISAEYKDAYKFARLIVKADLDGDRRPEVYNVIYWPEKRRIMRAEKYRIRKNIPCIVPWKFIGRDGRFAGVSMLKDGKDLFGEINAFHRHRSNMRRLTANITIVAPNSMKEALGDDYEFTPGGCLWVPDSMFQEGKLPRQLQLFNVDNNSERDEAATVRFLEGLIGPSMGMSGQETPGDSNAPGNKTAMLLQRADYRVADYIDEWKRSIPSMMALHTALIYQNYSYKIAFRNKLGDEDEIDTSMLVSEFAKWSLTANDISVSPEMEMSRIMNMAKFASALYGIPFKIDPKIMTTIWNDLVTASRLNGWERYILRMDAQPGQQGPQQPGQPQPQNQAQPPVPGGQNLVKDEIK